MTIDREQEFVHQFHYDARNLEFEKENGQPETSLNVQFHLIDDANLPATDTAISGLLTFTIVLEQVVLSGHISQKSYLRGKRIESKEALANEDMQTLASPLFDMLRRLTYETTEVALDMPGITLEF